MIKVRRIVLGFLLIMISEHSEAVYSIRGVYSVDGTSVTLICTPDDAPNVFRWTQLVVSGSSNRYIYRGDNCALQAASPPNSYTPICDRDNYNFNLTIDPISSATDQGNWTCQNDGVAASSSTPLVNYIEPPTDVTITKPDTINEEDDVEVTCTCTTGSPAIILSLTITQGSVTEPTVNGSLTNMRAPNAVATVTATFKAKEDGNVKCEAWGGGAAQPFPKTESFTITAAGCADVQCSDCVGVAVFDIVLNSFCILVIAYSIYLIVVFKDSANGVEVGLLHSMLMVRVVFFAKVVIFIINVAVLVAVLILKWFTCCPECKDHLIAVFVMIALTGVSCVILIVVHISKFGSKLVKKTPPVKPKDGEGGNALVAQTGKNGTDAKSGNKQNPVNGKKSDAQQGNKTAEEKKEKSAAV